MSNIKLIPFNSPLEIGVRTLTILIVSYPKAHDLNRLVQYDYLTVHSEDAGGPQSLHPPLPFRSGELLVRRSLIEAGLRLMISRSLIKQECQSMGILYSAEDSAGSFLDSLRSNYILELRNRASWVADTFNDLSSVELDVVVNRLFDMWTTEFQPIDSGQQSEISL